MHPVCRLRHMAIPPAYSGNLDGFLSWGYVILKASRSFIWSLASEVRVYVSDKFGSWIRKSVAFTTFCREFAPKPCY